MKIHGECKEDEKHFVSSQELRVDGRELKVKATKIVRNLKEKYIKLPE